MRRGSGSRRSGIEGIPRRAAGRRPRSAADVLAVVLSVAVLAGSWGGIGYALGGWPGAAIGAGAGLLAGAALWWVVSRVRIG